MKTRDLIDKQLDDSKVEEIITIDVSKISSLADYVIIGTGRSTKHIESTIDNLKRTLKGKKIPIMYASRDAGDGWAVLDAGNVIVHIFTKEMRDDYRLEELWTTGGEIIAKKTAPVKSAKKTDGKAAPKRTNGAGVRAAKDSQKSKSIAPKGRSRPAGDGAKKTSTRVAAQKKSSIASSRATDLNAKTDKSPAVGKGRKAPSRPVKSDIELKSPSKKPARSSTGKAEKPDSVPAKKMACGPAPKADSGAKTIPAKPLIEKPKRVSGKSAIAVRLEKKRAAAAAPSKKPMAKKTPAKK